MGSRKGDSPIKKFSRFSGFLRYVLVEHANPARRFFEFARFNPCFLLAGLAAVGLWGLSAVERPDVNFDPGRTVRMVGRVSASPEPVEGGLYFELTPEALEQSGRQVQYPGRIAVYLYSSNPDPAALFQPPLSYGERIRLNAFLIEPSHYAVPGVADFRDNHWLRGILHAVRLKSSRQVERLERDAGCPVLRTLFRFGERFQRYCRRRFTASQSKLMLGAFLGRRRLFDPPDLEIVKRLGVFHLFVVSGFHVSLVAAAFHLLFRRLRGLGRFFSMAAMWGYVLLCGAGLATLRAALMTSLFYVFVTFGLARSFLNGLGIAVLLLLAVWPNAVFSAGFQFSCLSLAGIGLWVVPWARLYAAARRGAAEVFTPSVSLARDAASRLRRRTRFAIEQRTEFLPRRLVMPAARWAGAVVACGAALLHCNLAIQMTVFPLSLFYSNRVVWTQCVANFFLTPLFAGFLPFCLVLFMFFTTPAEAVLSGAAAAYADAIDFVMSSLDVISWTSWHAHPTLTESAVCLALAGAALLLPRLWKLSALAGPALLLFMVSLPRSDLEGKFSVTMLDVGQGESIHLRYPNGLDALVDAGGLRSATGAPSRFVGERLVGRYLRRERSAGLRYILLSHPHVDHIQGIEFLGESFPVGELRHYEPHASYSGFKRRKLKRGDRFHLAGVEHEILHPGERIRWDTNDASLVLLVRYGRFSMLFSGDVEKGAERALLSRLTPVTVLKTPHHGGRTSSTRAFLERLQPKVALISAGRRNIFGHPSAETLDRMSRLGVAVLTTPQWGALRVVTDGRSWKVLHWAQKKKKFVALLAGVEKERHDGHSKRRPEAPPRFAKRLVPN